MIRTFLVTFSDGVQKRYDALSAQQLCHHLSKYFHNFTLEILL